MQSHWSEQHGQRHVLLTGSTDSQGEGMSWVQGPSREFSQKQQEVRPEAGLRTRLQNRSKVHQETGLKTSTPVMYLGQSGGPSLSLNGTSGPMGKVHGWDTQMKLVMAFKANYRSLTYFVSDHIKYLQCSCNEVTIIYLLLLPGIVCY